MSVIGSNLVPPALGSHNALRAVQNSTASFVGQAHNQGEKVSTLTDVVPPLVATPASLSASRASPAQSKVQHTSVQLSFWTNKQNLRTLEQFSSAAKAIYSTVPNATRILKGLI